jgi:hypothetical protein
VPVGQPGRFDDHAVEAQLAGLPLGLKLAQDPNQVTAHRAADASVVHFHDLLALVLHQQFVVDTGFAELVLDHGDAVAVLFLQDAVEQGGLAAAQEAGEDGDGGLHGALHRAASVPGRAECPPSARRGLIC